MKISSTKKSGGAPCSPAQGKYTPKPHGKNTQKKDRPSSTGSSHQKMHY